MQTWSSATFESNLQKLTPVLVLGAGLARMPLTLGVKDGKQEHSIVETIVFDLLISISPAHFYHRRSHYRKAQRPLMDRTFPA